MIALPLPQLLPPPRVNESTFQATSHFIQPISTWQETEVDLPTFIDLVQD